MDMRSMLALADWKKEGAYIGLEYRLQVGAYWGAPLCFDKLTGQVEPKPVADCALVSWVGPSGVHVKLRMTKEELAASLAAFRQALALYRFMREHDRFIAEEESRYRHPTQPGETLVSVTQVLKHVCGKPGLMNWYYEGGLEAGLRLAPSLDGVREAALAAKHGLNEKTITRSDEAAQPWKDVLQRAQDEELSPTAKRDAAGVTGSRIHKNVMFYLQGKTVNLTDAPPWLSETMAKFAAWGQRVKLEPVLVEQMVFDPDAGYAGTLDALVRMKEEGLHVG